MQPSQDLEDVESEWNDENADDAENATPSRQLVPTVNQPETALVRPYLYPPAPGVVSNAASISQVSRLCLFTCRTQKGTAVGRLSVPVLRLHA